MRPLVPTSACGVVSLRIAPAVIGARRIGAPARATTIERVVSARRHRGLAGARAGGAADRRRLRLRGRRRPGSAGKAGTADFVASLLDEGAGDFDSKTFHDRLDRKAIEMSFQRRPRHIHGSLRTLSENRDEAFDDLRLALTAPRFDAADVEINRAQIMSSLRRADDEPDRYRQPALVGDGVRRPSLRPAGERHAGIGADHHHRRSARPIRIGCWRATISRSPSSATSTRKRQRPCSTACSVRCRRSRSWRRSRPSSPQGSAPHRRQSRRAAGGGRFRRPRHRAQGSGFHGRLYRQPHSRRRLVFLAALSGSAREARPGLFGLRQPVVARSRRGVSRRRPRRAPTAPAKRWI